jgi:hypothetical protein
MKRNPTVNDESEYDDDELNTSIPVKKKSTKKRQQAMKTKKR